MRNYKLNTGICPVVCVSTYGTFFDFSNDIDQMERTKEDLQEYYDVPETLLDSVNADLWNSFDSSAYLQAICKKAIEYMEENCLETWKKFIPSIRGLTFYKTWIPKEYNFHGDECDFYVIADKRIKKQLLKYAETTEGFWDWLHETWKSFDGFISFVPHYEYDWKRALNSKDFAYCLATVLHHIIYIKEGKNFQDFVNYHFYSFATDWGDLEPEDFMQWQKVPEYLANARELEQENANA